jgi:hypothetical protein
LTRIAQQTFRKVRVPVGEPTSALPQSVKGGVRFIREDISSLEEDLSSIDIISSRGNGTLQFTFSADSKTMDSDAFYVRKDLGLPSSRAL